MSSDSDAKGAKMTMRRLYFHGMTTGGLFAFGLKNLVEGNWVMASIDLSVALIGFLWMVTLTSPPTMK